jgi:Tol biopolymer transport system component
VALVVVPRSVVVGTSMVAVLLLATAAAGSVRTAAALSGRFVLACSGCPQNTSGPSLYVVRADGKGFRKLELSGAGAGASPYHPRWSPHASAIAFSSGFKAIWTLDLKRGKTRRLTHSSALAGDDGPAWSPDGRRLAFSRDGAIYTVTRRSGLVRRLVRRAEKRFLSPDWSSGGRRLVFNSSDDRLFTVQANGRGLRRLPPRLARYPRWSPDGKLIAFIKPAARESLPPRLLVARADGSHTRIVVSRDDINWNVNPAWSRDGRRIAFVITKVFDPQNGYHGNEIVTVRLDGSDPRPVEIPQLPLDVYSEFYGIDWAG